MALYNLATGLYDAEFFRTGDGGEVTYSYTAAQLTAAGVDLSAAYALHYYENDEGGWGWGQLNGVDLAAEVYDLRGVHANYEPFRIVGPICETTISFAAQKAVQSGSKISAEWLVSSSV